MLPEEFERELDLPLGPYEFFLDAGTTYTPRPRGSYRGIGIVKLRGVEDVEELGSKLDKSVLVFRVVSLFLKSKVELPRRWAGQNAHA